jgi:hypothetical protein
MKKKKFKPGQKTLESCTYLFDVCVLGIAVVKHKHKLDLGIADVAVPA